MIVEGKQGHGRDKLGAGKTKLNCIGISAPRQIFLGLVREAKNIVTMVSGKANSLLTLTGDRLATIARPEAKPMKYHSSPWKLVLLAGTTLVLGSPTTVTAQSYNPVEPFPEDLPATGNINDLDGLQERQVEDWFPQQNIGTDSQTLLEINTTNTPALSINDRSSQIKEENDWQRSSSGEPKQTGSGFPLGTF